MSTTSSLPASYITSGLSSGLPDAQLIQALVAAQQQPITLLGSQQSALQTQVSTLGSIASDLTALQTAVSDLADTGAVASGVTSQNTTFSASAGTQAVAGQYSVQVKALAEAAKARSQGFSPSTPVTGGQLTLTVQGSTYQVAVADGATLAEVASGINQSGAPVTASVISDGVNQYLELSNQQSGYPTASTPGSALSISEATTGSQGQPLSLSVFQQAANASLTVDGLAITSSTNSVSEVIPGVTLNLTSVGTSAENLSIATDPNGTASNIESFVTAYNTLSAALQAQLNSPSTPGSSSPAPPLSGDAAVLGLQQQLQQTLTTVVPGLSGLSTLADLGITSSGQTGALTINSSILIAALNRNPQGVDQMFSQSATGLGSVFSSLASSFADPVSGALTQESTNLNTRIQAMSKQMAKMESELNDYQNSLNQQFAAMEQVVSGFKTVGNYLTQLDAASTSSSRSG